MYSFNQKRLSLIILCVLIGVFTFSFKIASSEKITEVSSKEVTSLPVSGKTIVLDAGHGLPDNGASSNNGTAEANINLSITLKVQKLLEQSGCTVILTRSDENGIYDLDKTTLREKKISDIKNRVKIGNNSSADILVSIHLNKISQQQYYGWQCFFKNKNDDSIKLAKSIQSNLNESIQKENKRVALKIDKIYLVDHVQIPISIVECGFLSNEREEKELQDDNYQERIAWGIYNGIIEYFN